MAHEEPRGERRRPRWLRTLTAVVAVLAAVGLLFRAGLVPGVPDLFGEETHDRTGPALLESLRDISRYDAASGTFQVVVDLEKDAKFLPDAVRGTRTLYVGVGTVDAYVDLGELGEERVTVNEERTEATLVLPHARLGDPALDADRSYAVAKERGLLDRLGDLFSGNPGDERAVQRLAVDHIGEAAQESELTARAEANTTSMLRSLLSSLGFERVTVRYDDR
ncbi:DUF4230 domain-containing protein [Streptomyces sp. TRM 70351]|uniref:DUF4230 domain-containing protein n=1 Tax=Streptomyces sp. TRM 70351 TaxID=3116552 RepID=UPI002E7AFA55|nr:DUF4230 domain-containing protein [Streptomyces sp. TRM 70351]MEE1928256.1 DUF4230 domain-containing protein [Streptomyces sp. TRM 70351]